MSRYPQKRSASIPALHAIQARYGWCSPEGIEQAATVMDVDPAYLESVASFYDLFHLEPAGRHQVLVCTNISCWMRGADELLEAVCEAAGADPDHAGHGGAVNEAGDIYVSGFECLGACDIAPMASIDERYYGPLTEADAPTIVEQLRSGAEVLHGQGPGQAPRRRRPRAGPGPPRSRRGLRPASGRTAAAPRWARVGQDGTVVRGIPDLYVADSSHRRTTVHAQLGNELTRARRYRQ